MNLIEAGFLTLGAVDMWGRVILCGSGCPVDV